MPADGGWSAAHGWLAYAMTPTIARVTRSTRDREAARRPRIHGREGGHQAAAVLLAIVATACTHPHPPPEPRGASAQPTERSPGFWPRMAAFDPTAAAVGASPSEQRLAQAFALQLEGEHAEAQRDYQRLLDEPDEQVAAAAAFLFANLAVHTEQHSLVLRVLGEEGADPSTLTLLRAFSRAPRSRLHMDADRSRGELHESSGGTPIVDVTLNGVTVPLWLDTAASLTTLSASVAEAAGVEPLRQGTVSSDTSTTRSVDARPASIDELGLQAARLEHVDALIMPDEALTIGDGEQRIVIGGLLGWNVLRHLGLELDRQRRELRLSSTPPCTPGPRNLRWLVHPLVELEVEGEPAIFMLDTGSDTTELAAAGRLGARARGAPRQAWTTHGAGGSESTSLPVVAELRLAVDDWAITLEHVPVRDLPALGFGQIDGRLGQDAWAGATLQICGSTGRLGVVGRAPGP